MYSIFRVVSLLQNGAVMNKVFQPHEAHIPYLLQVKYLGSKLIQLFRLLFILLQENTLLFKLHVPNVAVTSM